ncbi:UNVERIFIED_CONTAM: hypothetical protein HDU68_011290 [Siphonaria sp. JEL0065]|nr:hypothetical protein HDU68_011290 [Siphonaria sp. JEL0065]
MAANATAAAFVPFTSGKTVFNAGILHLFREKDPPPLHESMPSSDTPPTPTNTVCILAVPLYMTAPDLLVFIAPYTAAISHIRFLKDSIQSRSMVLIRFRDGAAFDGEAEAFYGEYSGRLFNSLDDEVCRVVYIKSVHFQPIPTDPDQITTDQHPNLQPLDLQQLQPQQQQNHCQTCNTTQNLWICLICGNVGCGRYQSAHAAAHFTSTAHLYSLELETQRVWDYAGDGYVHRLIRTGQDGKVVELSAPASINGTHPFGFRTRGGGIGGGGGRFGDGKSGKGKGKGKEYGFGGKPFYGNPDDYDDEDEEDALGLEYSVLLSSQLESQRCWYEEKMDALAIESSEKLQSVTDELEKSTLEQSRLVQEKESILQIATLEKLQLEEKALRDREKWEKKFEKLFERVHVLEKSFAEEKQINESLRQNQDEFLLRIEKRDKELAEKDKQVEDLTEQVRDLMFYLETQQKVKESPDMQNGDVVIETAPEVVASTSSSKSKKKKKK